MDKNAVIQKKFKLLILSLGLVLYQSLPDGSRFGAHAQPCLAETQLFGGATLDKSPDEYEEYFVVQDDDLTRVTQMRYCKCCINGNGDYEHFRGFEVGITSPTSGYSFQTFGTVNGTDPDTVCETQYMGLEELMYLTIFVDSNDVEGMIWEGNFGTTWTQRANGNKPSPKMNLGGRPIGFRVWMGDGGMENQPLTLAVIYNSCNCPASTYIGNNPFNDMEIEAVVGPTQTQTLKYQENYMNSVYGQDCGSYSIDYYPKYPFFSFSKAGSVDYAGRPYTDLGTFVTGTLDDVGQYPVTMVTYQEATDAEQGFSQPYVGNIPLAEQQFMLTINPCTVNKMDANVKQPDMQYFVTELGITQGTYDFIDSPNQCGYDQTITVSGLPPFMSHDDVNREFTIDEQLDNTFVGKYTVTIETEIEVPDDYTKTTFTQHVGTDTFDVFVEPCQVQQIIATPINNMEYVIGHPDEVISEMYHFEQIPACGYPIDVTITGMPSVATHDPINQSVTIPFTEQLGLHGLYTATVTAEIEHFRDYKMDSTRKVNTDFTFEINMIDPCFQSVMEPLDIPDIYNTVLNPEVPSTFVDTEDTVSQNFHNMDGLTYCGPRVYTVLTPDNVWKDFMQFDDVTRTFTVQTDDPTHVGVYPIEVQVHLENYPDVKTTTIMEVEIDYCQVADMFQTSVPSQFYNVYTPSISFGAAPFTMDPACGYTLDYTFMLKDMVTGQYSPLPSWIKHVGDRDFEVYTDDPANVGNYQIAVIGSVPAPFMDPTYTEEVLIDLEVDNQCQTDIVTPLSTIANELYYIDEDGTRSFNPTWSTAIPGCPATYEIGLIENGVERPLTADEKAVINFDDTDGSMSYSTSDFGLDGQIWPIRIYKKSTYSEIPEGEGEYTFDIEFRDLCWDSSLQAAEFHNPDYVFDVWQLQQMTHDLMQDLSLGNGYCGGTTTVLEYVDGDLMDPVNGPPDLSHFTFSDISLTEGTMDTTLEDFLWVGEHKLRLKSTLGTYDPSPDARGVNGLYGTVYGQTVDYKVINPCVNSTVNEDQGLQVISLAVPVGQDLMKMGYAGPTDWTSSIYGNGYDKCGPLKYDYLDLGRTQVFQNLQFTNFEQRKPDSADYFQMNLRSNITGTELTANATLRISLLDYPSATPAYFVVNMTYRECFPYAFDVPAVEPVEIQVGQEGFDLDVEFSQYPCNYDQTYTVTLKDKTTGAEVELPAFMTPDGEIIILDSPTNNDVGEYEVTVCSTISNSLQTTECVDFDLNVTPQPSGVYVQKEPEFMLDLEDQTILAGDALIYEPDSRLDDYGLEMDMEVDLGDAFRFAEYDPISNQFIIHSTLVTDEDAGVYPVDVKARYFNESFNAEFGKTFMLTILPHEKEPPEPWFPEDPIFYEDWEISSYIRANTTQEYDPERPIPQILNLDESGILTIGWDRKMLRPDNITKIEPARVAVEENYEHEDERFWQDRRWLRSLRTYYDFEPRVGEHEVVYFADNTTRTYERMKLIEALELRITPDNLETDRQVRFTWEMIDFDDDYIWIQLHYENYWEISGDTQFDTLSVAFWGVELFKSKQGKEVLYGTTLYWPIMRQLTKEEKAAVDTVMDIIRVLAWVSFLVILPAVTAGSLLPTWMYINSSMIISHMCLLKCIMPAVTHYFLRRYNNWMRWYDDDFERHMGDLFDYYRLPLDFGAYHELLQMSDYSHLMARNLMLIILGLLLIVAVWLVCVAKDFFFGMVYHGQAPTFRSWGEWMQNFALRYFYLFFLELSICVLLQFTIVEDAKAPAFQLFLAIFAFLLMVGLVAFLGYLLFFSGPRLQGFYTKGTAIPSLLSARTRNRDFPAQAWLQTHPERKVQPWGSFLINIDLDKIDMLKDKFRKTKPTELPDQNKELKKEKEPQDEDGAETERKLLSEENEPQGLDEEPQLLLPNEGKPDVDEPESKPKAPVLLNDDTWEGQEPSVELPVGQQAVTPAPKKPAEDELYEGGSNVATPAKASEPCIDVSKKGLQKDADAVNEQQVKADKKNAEQYGEAYVQHKLEKAALDKKMRVAARQRIRFEETVWPNRGYKTLFYGLKRNHERSVAVVHPLMFLVRRFIYALVIVFASQVMFTGVLIVMFSTLVMLAYALTEHQWRPSIINKQHIFDEITIYVLTVILLMFSSFITAVGRYTLGIALIGIVFLYVIVNTIIILYYSLRIMLKYLRRVVIQCRVKNLRRKAVKQINKINEAREQYAIQQNWLLPDFFILPFYTIGKGYGSVMMEGKERPPELESAPEVSVVREPTEPEPSLEQTIPAQDQPLNPPQEEESSMDFFMPDDLPEPNPNLEFEKKMEVVVLDSEPSESKKSSKKPTEKSEQDSGAWFDPDNEGDDLDYEKVEVTTYKKIILYDDADTLSEEDGQKKNEKLVKNMKQPYQTQQKMENSQGMSGSQDWEIVNSKSFLVKNDAIDMTDLELGSAQTKDDFVGEFRQNTKKVKGILSDHNSDADTEPQKKEAGKFDRPKTKRAGKNVTDEGIFLKNKLTRIVNDNDDSNHDSAKRTQKPVHHAKASTTKYENTVHRVDISSENLSREIEDTLGKSQLEDTFEMQKPGPQASLSKPVRETVDAKRQEAKKNKAKEKGNLDPNAVLISLDSFKRMSEDEGEISPIPYEQNSRQKAKARVVTNTQKDDEDNHLSLERRPQKKPNSLAVEENPTWYHQNPKTVATKNPTLETPIQKWDLDNHDSYLLNKEHMGSYQSFILGERTSSTLVPNAKYGSAIQPTDNGRISKAHIGSINKETSGKLFSLGQKQATPAQIKFRREGNTRNYIEPVLSSYKGAEAPRPAVEYLESGVMKEFGNEKMSLGNKDPVFGQSMRYDRMKTAMEYAGSKVQKIGKNQYQTAYDSRLEMTEVQKPNKRSDSVSLGGDHNPDSLSQYEAPKNPPKRTGLSKHNVSQTSLASLGMYRLNNINEASYQSQLSSKQHSDSIGDLSVELGAQQNGKSFPAEKATSPRKNKRVNQWEKRQSLNESMPSRQESRKWGVGYDFHYRGPGSLGAESARSNSISHVSVEVVPFGQGKKTVETAKDHISAMRNIGRSSLDRDGRDRSTSDARF